MTDQLACCLDLEQSWPILDDQDTDHDSAHVMAKWRLKVYSTHSSLLVL